MCRWRATILAILARLPCLVVLLACAGTSHGQAPAETVWPTTSWTASTAEEQGLDSGSLARLIDTVGARKQDSLLVIRHGRIVAEAYYAPYAADIAHDLRSVTKSVVSTLTAIEIQQGLLAGVDRPIVSFFPDKTIANLDDNKRAMTVQSLLDMTSGIEWLEKSYTPDESIIRMYRSPDPTEFVLNQPMSGAPGSKFYYNSGNPYVLSALINKLTGHSALEFAKAELFGPLGISSARWGEVDAQGVTDGEAGLFLTPRDMAKIGYLYLHDGLWEGRRIIPSSWVERARAGKIQATFGFHYANLWWSLPEKGAYMALGRHSQIILVLPGLDIIAVMTGIMGDDEYYPTARLIDDIAGAVKSDKPLPPDAVAQSLLAASIRGAATERPSPLGETPDSAKTISGKLYRFGDNELHVRTISLNLVDAPASWEITTKESAAPPERFAGLLGLEGVFQLSPRASYGINAVKGRWLNAHTFSIERRILGHGETQFWALAFDGKTVDVSFVSSDGLKVELRGEATD